MNAPMSLIGADDLAQMVELASRTPYGPFIEVGVYHGGSAWPLANLAREQRRFLYLCDTFEGIPYADPALDSHRPGDFGDVAYEDIVAVFQAFHPYVEFVKGVFPQSWQEHPGIPEPRFAFAHLDCDQYQSVKAASEWLLPRMLKGGVIWFDDVDRLKGASQAALEVFGQFGLRRDLSHPYVRFE